MLGAKQGIVYVLSEPASTGQREKETVSVQWGTSCAGSIAMAATRVQSLSPERIGVGEWGHSDGENNKCKGPKEKEPIGLSGILRRQAGGTQNTRQEVQR